VSSDVQIEESVHIARPPAVVWDAIADYSLDAEWRKGIREMTPDPPGPPAIGTRVHEVLRLSGRDYVTDATVTELDEGVSYAFEGKGTSGDVQGGRTVRADGDGAVFTYRIGLQPKRSLRLLGPVLASMLRSGLRKDLKRLKTLVESRA
jgi:hypothetical protein